jgi:Domain of unknown function (DUF4157)
MREYVSRQKKTTIGFSIPSLKQPTPGFGLESSAISRQAVPEIQPLNKPVTHDISRIPLRTQAKLSISQPGDIYEQEADSVAQQVMQRMAQPVNHQSIQREALPEEEEELQMKPLDISTLQREALPEEEEELQMKPLDNSTLQREALPEEEEELQMKSLDNSTLQREALPDEEEELQMKPMVQRQGEAGMAATPDLETSINQARGGGQLMADNIREPMEMAFGADFSGVKVHTDGQSDQLNRSIQARAFTTGQDVFFRQGEYTPGSRGGQELLAHELTHVVQQSGVREQAIGDIYRISRTTEPIVQCVLDGTAVNGQQQFQYGLVKGTYTPNDNKVDAHIEPGSDGQGLQKGDMLSAVQDIYQAMLARNQAGGPIGEVQMRPQGAVALKTVVELLGGALGGWFGKAQAATYQWKRKKFGELTKGKMADELDQEIIPEHMAFLGSLVDVGGVTIAPILGGEKSMQEFIQNMLENTPAGKARMETYKARLIADQAVSMNVKVSQAVLPEIINLLQQ